MYGEEKVLLSEPKQEEYIAVAEDMARAILNRNFDEQNFMVSHIRKFVLSQRQEELETTEKRLAYIKQTLEKL